jgi:hypothetical protein
VQAALWLRALPAFLAAATMIVATALQAGAQGTGCYFQLGFANLAKQIPDAVGKCTANERFNPANGNAEQPTDRGLLVWRKADNWTAYTDGYRTWLAGPNGLQDRLNDAPRFEWEQDIVDINANSNTNDLANTNTITAEGGNATGGTANAQGGASTNINTNTVNPVINVVVNVPPSAPTPTVASTPTAPATPTPIPMRNVVTSTIILPSSTVSSEALAASIGQWTAWGRQGNEIGALNRPHRIAASSNGAVFVIDNNDNDYGGRLQKFDPTDACQCWWVSAGALDRSQIQYTLITDIYMSSSDQIYIRKSNDRFIQIESYTPDLKLKQDPIQVSLSSNRYSESIAIDRFGAIYAANTTTILKIGPDGNVIATWGGPGKGPGQFSRISGIALDSAGNVYVADASNNRIQKLSASGGRPLAQWGTSGSGPGQFSMLSDIALDTQGNIYVADTGNHRIQKLSPDGKFLQQWGNMGQFGNKPQKGTEPGQFNSPGGVAIDVKGNVYVADTGNDRIQKLILNP